MFSVRSLPSLPTYGPRAVSFPTPNAFREGFVVEFANTKGEAWVANFERYDESGLDSIGSQLGSQAIFIVAGGSGYIFDATDCRVVREIGGRIGAMWFCDHLKAFVVADDVSFEAFDAEHTLWQSRRVSFDGFRNLKMDELTITGEAYDPSTTDDESWVPFRLLLATGEVEGGSYPSD